VKAEEEEAVKAQGEAEKVEEGAVKVEPMAVTGGGA